MVWVTLLEQLKTLTETAVKDLILPVDTVETGRDEPDRAADVYIPRLPHLDTFRSKAPFITHEIILSEDGLDTGPSGALFLASRATVRSCFCVYHPDEQEGGLALLNLMERVRIAISKAGWLGKQFKLDLGRKIQTMVYPDALYQVTSAPYYLGEMITVWGVPPVKRELVSREPGHSNIK